MRTRDKYICNMIFFIPILGGATNVCSSTLVIIILGCRKAISKNSYALN